MSACFVKKFFSGCSPDDVLALNTHTDHLRLEEVIKFKEIMEERFMTISKKREDQFQSQLKKLQDAYIEGSVKSRLLEQTAMQISREIDSYTSQMHQHTTHEKENLMKVFHMDETVSFDIY